MADSAAGTATPEAGVVAAAAAAAAGSDAAAGAAAAGGESSPEAKATTTDQGKAPAGAPETYAAFTLPDGVTLDAKVLESAVPLLKELNLTQDQAQKLVSFQAQFVADQQAAAVQAFATLKADWAKESAADPEIGGAKFEATRTAARAAVDKLGTPAFKNLLSDTGVGNHVEFLRVFAKIAELVKEAPVVTGSSAQDTPSTLGAALYKNSTITPPK